MVAKPHAGESQNGSKNYCASPPTCYEETMIAVIDPPNLPFPFLSLFILILSALAVFRLSELVAYDKGPFHIFKRLRNLFPQGSLIDEMLECIYCTGIWSSLLATTWLWWIGLVAGKLFIFWWLGIAGLAIVIYRSIRPRK